METELKLLAALLKNRQKRFTIHEISKEIGADYRIVHTAAERLFKKGLVDKAKIGNAIELRLTDKFSTEIFQAEFQRREELLKDSEMRILHEKLQALKFPFIALLFGSRTSKKAKRSDIDLMVVCEKNHEKDIEEVISLLPLNIHLTALTYGEFSEMAKSKTFNVVNEAMKNNIPLVGIEEYHRLVKNAE